MYISATSPLSLLLIIKNGNLFMFSFAKYKIYFLVLILYFIFGIGFTCVFLRRVKKFKITEGSKKEEGISNINSEDINILNFFITFYIPLISLNLEDGWSVLTNLLLFLLEAVYIISNRIVYNNLYFMLFGYHIYSYEKDNDQIHYIISKKTVNTIKKSDIYSITNGGVFYYAE